MKRLGSLATTTIVVGLLLLLSSLGSWPRAAAPAELAAEIRGELYDGAAPGDSVRYVIRFAPPAAAELVDSITLEWGLGDNPPQRHTYRRPFPAAIQDTARFANVPSHAGGSGASGSVELRTWRLDGASSGVVRTFDVVRPPATAPPNVSAVVWVDSAIAYP